MERMMKVQEVILKAMAGSLDGWEDAEIVGVTERTMRRWRERYEKDGYDGLYDYRKQQPRPKRIAVKTLEEVLQLYREKYFDFNVRHFHEKLSEEHSIDLSYTWVKLALQGAGLVAKQRRRGTHRRRRPRRPLPGMLLHIDASKHAWFQDGRHWDLIQELGIKMIPAYSPQARGRMERSYRTWQGRLPQELRLRKITTVEEANGFLRQEYRAEFNRRFAVAAAGKGSAFVRTRRKDLAWVFSIQHERRVNADNTIALDNRILQIEKSRWRNTLAGCNVRVYELMDGTVAVRFGPHEVARWAPGSLPAPQPKVGSGARPLGHHRQAA